MHIIDIIYYRIVWRLFCSNIFLFYSICFAERMFQLIPTIFQHKYTICDLRSYVIQLSLSCAFLRENIFGTFKNLHMSTRKASVCNQDILFYS